MKSCLSRTLKALMLMFIQNCNKNIQCYIVLQQKIQCYIGSATKHEPVCPAAQCSGGLPNVLIVLLFLFNMMYSVQFRKKRCHFWFGFVEADEVFSCFPSDRSSQIPKRNIFHGLSLQQWQSPFHLRLGNVSVATSAVLMAN